MPLELPAGVFSTPAPSSTRNRPARLTDKYRDEGGVLFRRFTFSAQTLHALKASVGTGNNCNIVLTTNDVTLLVAFFFGGMEIKSPVENAEEPYGYSVFLVKQ